MQNVLLLLLYPTLECKYYLQAPWPGSLRSGAPSIGVSLFHLIAHAASHLDDEHGEGHGGTQDTCADRAAASGTGELGGWAGDRGGADRAAGCDREAGGWDGRGWDGWGWDGWGWDGGEGGRGLLGHGRGGRDGLWSSSWDEVDRAASDGGQDDLWDGDLGGDGLDGRAASEGGLQNNSGDWAGLGAVAWWGTDNNIWVGWDVWRADTLEVGCGAVDLSLASSIGSQTLKDLGGEV